MQSPDSDHPISGFTAVNGRSPPSNGRPRGSTNNSDEHSNQSNGHDTIVNGNATLPDAHPSQPNHHAEHTRNDSGSSSKRKRVTSDEDEDSSASDSSKRRRDSAHQGVPDMMNGQWGHRPSGQGSTSSEARLVEALGRETEHTAQHMGSVSDSSPGAYQLSTPQHASHGGMQIVPGMSAPQQALHNKQRKRNFANRTKTGCLTCRERKKKCDEAKPLCNNCHRGGFDCKGYSQTNPLLKQPLSRDHPPIQAKNGAFETLPTQTYPQPAYVPGPSFYPAPPEINGHPPPPPRPIPSQEEHQRSMNEQNMRMSYARPSWPDPFAQHYQPEHMRHDQPMPMSYSDPSRDPKRLPPVQQGPAPMPATTQMQPPPPRNPPYIDPTRSSPYTDTSMNLAQAALQHHNHYRAPPAAPMKTEKDKMINAMPFNPNDPTLKAERHVCEVAVYNYNKGAADPTMLTEHERRERFRTIVEGKPEHFLKSPGNRDLNKGYVGQNVSVKAPFYCDYGYNLKIGDNTDIGKNCTMSDACTIKIGNNCIVGPDVSFYSQDGEHHPRFPRPDGQKRLMVAKPIIIDDDVFIGGKAVILPGVTIGRGATIGANAIVMDPVPPGNTVVNRFLEKTRFPKGSWGTN